MVKLELAPQIEALLEERAIKAEDIQKVIAYAEMTGNIYVNSVTGHYISYHKPSTTTYWVEYGHEGDLCRIYSAYSHRMVILEGFSTPANRKEKSDWLCLKCKVQLEISTVKLTYLDETLVADIPACPSCKRVYVSEETALQKMAVAEKMLEDK
jgi:hypothetical protein